MTQPIGYLNGRWVEPAELVVPIHDTGFVLGATVTEQLRTFHGEIFELEAHLDRLQRSLDIVGIDCGLSRDELGEITRHVAARNYQLLVPDDDLGLGIFVTPGPHARFAPAGPAKPTVCVYSSPLPFGQWAEKYRQGERLVISSVRQIPQSSLPPALKCRSRMHYFLADREAAARDPGARALLLDQEGFVSEASTASLVAHFPSEGLVVPRPEKILPGISLMTLSEIAGELAIPLVSRDINPVELRRAAEVFLASTSVCLLSVTSIDADAVGDGRPGKTFHSLLSAWSRRVGLDIAGQAEQMAAGRVGLG